MHPATESARTEILDRIASDLAPEASHALRHAAQIAGTFKDRNRALFQMHQMARFHEGTKPKAKAYLDAAEIFARHTGAELPGPVPATVNRLHIAFTELDLGILPGFAAAAS